MHEVNVVSLVGRFYVSNTDDWTEHHNQERVVDKMVFIVLVWDPIQDNARTGHAAVGYINRSMPVCEWEYYVIYLIECITYIECKRNVTSYSLQLVP